MQAEQYYNSAHEHKPAALQPFHGLVQLYRRTGAHDKHAEALRHVLAHAKTEASQYDTLIQLAKALIDADKHIEANEVLHSIATEGDGPWGDDEILLPDEVSRLKADCQLALDETEYNTRIQSTIRAAHERAANSPTEQDLKDDACLTQEVAVTWVRCIPCTSVLVSVVACHYIYIYQLRGLLSPIMVLICGTVSSWNAPPLPAC